MSSAQSLKVLFLWHHHQPYYKADGSLLLPWVRMHGIKDYWDLVRILDDYPVIKQTFNFAPSLLEQLKDYLENRVSDTALALSRKDPATFSEQEKTDAIKKFFLANTERMVKRYPRYAQLLENRGTIKSDRDVYRAAAKFTDQDFRDLQVWWNLAWVGEYSRFDPPFKYYLDKGKGFSEEEKQRLLDAEIDILSRIVPSHIQAARRKQIEISVSPFYHPILPLLCNSDIATEANPQATLPEKPYRHAEDADYQVKSALDYSKKTFGFRVKGMWPSEGSVSDEALKIMIRNGVGWAATDEGILHKTLLKSRKELSSDFIEKYFPYNFVSDRGSLKIYFRDHGLSDLIGFAYSRSSPDDAAHNLVSRLIKIRDRIIAGFGEKGLDYAVVPIILDGENAWEFYQSDGKDFLRTLYYLLSNEPRLATVLPGDVETKPGNVLKHIEPGSWINGNFDIWIGQQEDNKAWDLLHDARGAFEKRSKHLSAKARANAYREVMIAEGSDWCWWYGDDHKSPQAMEFDYLFRYHIKQVYIKLGSLPPAELDTPIKRKPGQPTYRQPLKMISPKVGRLNEEAWENAGFVEHADETGAMQKSGMQIRRVYFGNDRDNLYLRIVTSQQLSGQKVMIEFFSPENMSLEIGGGIVFRSESDGPENAVKIQYRIGDTIQIALGGQATRGNEAALAVSVHEGDKVLDSIPSQGVVKFKLL